MEKEEVKENKREFVLPRKIVILKPLLDRASGMMKDPNHAAAFLVGTSNNIISAPNIKGKKIVDCPLTEEERTFFENKSKSGLSFEQGDLSAHCKKWGERKNKTWWETKDAQVKLAKDDVTFDLSSPMDYIAYKICLKSKKVARSRDDLKLSPEFRYVFEEEQSETRTKATKVEKKTAAYAHLANLNKDQGRMVDLCTVLGKRVTPNQDIAFLKVVLGDLIEDSVDKFLDAIEDEYFDEKVLIGKLLRNRLIDRKGNSYFLKSGEGMADKGLVPYLENAYHFLKNAENQEIRLTLTAKIK